MSSHAMIISLDFPIISWLKMGSCFLGTCLAAISWLPYKTRSPCCCPATAFKWNLRSCVPPRRDDMRLGSTSCMNRLHGLTRAASISRDCRSRSSKALYSQGTARPTLGYRKNVSPHGLELFVGLPLIEQLFCCGALDASDAVDGSSTGT